VIARSHNLRSLSVFFCLLSVVFCLLSFVCFLLSFIFCLLSFVFCLLSFVLKCFPVDAFYACILFLLFCVEIGGKLLVIDFYRTKEFVALTPSQQAKAKYRHFTREIYASHTQRTHALTHLLVARIYFYFLKKLLLLLSIIISIITYR
jgi:hypothetical protein